MKKVTIILIMAIFSSGCQSRKHSNNEPKEKNNNEIIDVLAIDFKNDLKNILEKINFQNTNPDFSEYLKSFTTKEVNKFSLDNLLFSDKFKLDKLEIPNESCVYFVTKQKNDKEISVIGIESNSLKSKSESLQHYIDVLGKPEKLNDETSINKMKGVDNFIWRNFSKEYTYILSQSSEGSIVSQNGELKKVTKSKLYIIDNKGVVFYLP